MLSSKADRNVMLDRCNYSAEKQISISEKFYELAQKHQMPGLSIYKNVFIAYCDFSEEIRTDVNNCVLVLMKEQFVKKYRPFAVWNIFALFSSLPVFYQKDSDIQRNQSNGISKQIKDEYYKALHRLDEFCVFSYDNFNVTFDSKENLDNHYEGSLYYYFK